MWTAQGFPWPWGFSVLADQFNTVTCRYDSSQPGTRIEHVVCACHFVREYSSAEGRPGPPNIEATLGPLGPCGPR
jgi:hypothetical protein